jgi:hypothetical protein
MIGDSMLYINPVQTNVNEAEVLYDLEILYQACNERLQAEKVEKALKDKFKKKLQGVGSIQTEKLILLISEMNRTDLDKEALQDFLGEEAYKKFTYQNTFLKVEIKRVG